MAKNTHIYFTEYRLSLLVIDWNMSYGDEYGRRKHG